MAIDKLTPVDQFPERKMEQERFDNTVKASMDQLHTMVDELNESFIPAVNEVIDDIETLKMKHIMMVSELPDEPPADLAENGILIVAPNAADQTEEIENNDE